jgi:hypothetical protein
MAIITLSGGRVGAATIVVDSLDDGSNGCTLRSAVLASTTRERQGTCLPGAGTDRIVFATHAAGPIGLDIARNGPIIVTDGSIVIQGSPAGTSVVAEGGTAMMVRSGAALEIADMTFTDASSSALVNEGTLRVRGCTFARNESVLGGAIYNTGAARIVNSTFYRNLALQLSGGAIASFGPLAVTNSTFLRNDAAPGAAGGAIFAGGPGTVTLRGVVIAADAGGDNCRLDTQHVNFGVNFSDDDSCGFDNGDLTDPLLDPAELADHGGPTETIALQANSPAIDAIPEALCTDAQGAAVNRDQRGFVRPAGLDCDAGAYERNAIAPAPTRTPLPLPPPPTPTRTPLPCIGDCAGDGAVTVDDIVIGVRIALQLEPVTACEAMDPGSDGTVTINELIRAIAAVLSGCTPAS